MENSRSILLIVNFRLNCIIDQIAIQFAQLFCNVPCRVPCIMCMLLFQLKWSSFLIITITFYFKLLANCVCCSGRVQKVWDKQQCHRQPKAGPGQRCQLAAASRGQRERCQCFCSWQQWTGGCCWGRGGGWEDETFRAQVGEEMFDAQANFQLVHSNH